MYGIIAQAREYLEEMFSTTSIASLSVPLVSRLETVNGYGSLERSLGEDYRQRIRVQTYPENAFVDGKRHNIGWTGSYHPMISRSIRRRSNLYVGGNSTISRKLKERRQRRKPAELVYIGQGDKRGEGRYVPFKRHTDLFR